VSGISICKHVRADGTACKAIATPSGFCFFHCPDRAEERAAAGRKGGKGKSKRRAVILAMADAPAITLRTVSDVLGALEGAATDARRGAMDCKLANAVGYLASIALRAIVASDFEERLSRLEALAQQQQRRA
jgi:hypothetical protein